MSTAQPVTEYPPWLNTPLVGVAAAVMTVFWYGWLIEIFVSPRPRGGGRLTTFVATLLTLVAALTSWVEVFNNNYAPTEWVARGAAVGVTVGGLGMLAVRLREGLVERRGGGVPASRPPGMQFLFEYLLGVWLCCLVLIAGSEIAHDELDHTVESWFAERGGDVAFYGTSGAVLMLGFIYSQVVAAAAVRALNTALAHDWQLTRNLHYALLVPPFLFVALLGPPPSIVAGAVVQLVSLLVCWRYTDDRPKTPLQALKWLLLVAGRRVGHRAASFR